MKLDFKTHPSGIGGTQAIVEFDNGIKVSIVCGEMFYSNGLDTYEIFVLDVPENISKVNMPAVEDPIGFRTEDEINEILTKLENYKAL